MKNDMSNCKMCPRECGVNRSDGDIGYCGVGSDIKIARAMIHMWEEPCISGTNGSGAVFFCGCPLGCVYCQNREISRCETGYGKTVSHEQFIEIILDLQGQGAHNINFVSPTQYTLQICDAISEISGELKIPVVWNTGGYEKVDTVKCLENIADIYLTDFKYAETAAAIEYSSAPDYPDKAMSALAEMVKQKGKYIIDDSGLMKQGVIVRHLVLPSHRNESIKILRLIAENINPDDILISLMSQYTPDYLAKDSKHKELTRRVTTFEYNSVCEEAERLGFKGFTQEKSSATNIYRPDFK